MYQLKSETEITSSNPLFICEIASDIVDDIVDPSMFLFYSNLNYV